MLLLVLDAFDWETCSFSWYGIWICNHPCAMKVLNMLSSVHNYIIAHFF